MTTKKEPFELCLHFTRDSGGDRTYVDVPKEPLKYQRHFPGGTVSIAEFPWHSDKIIQGLAELRKDRPSENVLAELGDELWAFLRGCGAGSSLEEACRNEQPIRITLLSAAAELYALPWELLRINAGRTLAQLDDCTIRYTWTSESSKTAVDVYGPSPEGGRILFAWSHGDGDEVPWKSHLREIENACATIAADEKTRLRFFDPREDVLQHASYRGLKNKLARAAEKDQNGETRPYRIVHLLCHGAEVERSKGLGLLLTSDDETTFENLDNTSLEKKTLSPDNLMTLFPRGASAPRLVVLCACLGSDAGRPDSRLGSVALATHRAGIESVIASRFLLSKTGSITLCKKLYSSLLGGPGSVEAALSAARAELSDSTDHAALQLFQNTTGWDTRPVIFRPYRGLLTFGLEHQRYFFGREAEINATLNALKNLTNGTRDEHGNLKPRFLIVAASSGTGKSSLVFAGVLPRLMKEYGFTWDTMRPLADPMATLDAVLAKRGTSSKPFLLIVDQFEEVFTQIKEPEDRTKFVRGLWQHASGDSSISVIVTLRVDFLGRCKEIVLDEKTGLLLEGVAYDEAHRVFVGQMDRKALRQVIEKPAKLVGIGFDEGLVNKLIEEAGHEPGALPLVEYALDQLWQKREWKNGREVLTWRTYDGTDGTDRTNRAEGTDVLGGVTGALAKKADSILADFDEMGKRAARQLLVQLVDMRQEAALDTRKRMRRDELRAGPSVDQLIFDQVLEKFTVERLVVTGKDGGDTIVEIAHEQLVRSWGTLRGWLNEDRQRVVECKRLERWVEDAKQSKQFLLTSDQLAIARRLVAQYGDDLGPEVHQLIQRTTSAARRKRYLSGFALVVVGAVLVVLTKVNIDRRDYKLQVRDNALVAYSRKLISRDPTMASRLLLEVSSREGTFGWTEAARETLATEFYETYTPDVLATSPDGKLRIVPSEETYLYDQKPAYAVFVQSVDDPTEKQRLTFISVYEPIRAHFAANGKRAVIRGGGAISVWQVNGTQFKREGDIREPNRGIRYFTSSPEGELLAVGYEKFVDVFAAQKQWKLLRTLNTHEGPINSVAFSPDGRHIVTASDDQTARVWPLEGDALVLRGHTGAVRSAQFSPDGARIVTASDDQTARVWTLDEPDKPLLLNGHTGAVVSAVFSAEGTRVATGSSDNTVRVWALDGSGTSVPLTGHVDTVEWVRFLPDGKRIVGATHQASIRVWNMEVPNASLELRGDNKVVPNFDGSSADDNEIRLNAQNSLYSWRLATPSLYAMLEPKSTYVSSLAYSPDGTKVLVSTGGTVYVWSRDDLDTPISALKDDHGAHLATFTHDGRNIVTVSLTNKSAREWTLGGQTTTFNLEWPGVDFWITAISGDGRHVLGIEKGNDGPAAPKRLRVWDLNGDHGIFDIVGIPMGNEVAALSPNGERAIVGTGRGEVRAFDVRTSMPLFSKDLGVQVSSVAFSPDGQRIACGTVYDGTVRVWELNGLPVPRMFEGKWGSIESIAFSGDGRRIVAAVGYYAYVWNVDGSGDAIVLDGHTKPVNHVAFAPDGRSVIVGSQGATEVWQLDGLESTSPFAQVLADKTSVCLSTFSRKVDLGESPEEAEKNCALCERDPRAYYRNKIRERSFLDRLLFQ